MSETTSVGGAGSRLSALTLDDLATRSASELAGLYAAGEVPKSIAELDGEPPGRVLAVPGSWGRRLSSAVRRLVVLERFPWLGKRFTSVDDQVGSGLNRFRIGRRMDRFAFRTRFGTSAIDGQRCIVLDYAVADNPFPIRRIHDELRRVAPGLFLGPAMWKRRGALDLLVWWAVDVGALGRGPRDSRK